MSYSAQRFLVILGLVLVPFYEIFLKVLPFVKSVAPDTREPKEIIALVFALSIGLLAVFQGSIKPFRNKWLLAIPVFLLFNLITSPHTDLFINGIESGDLYFWKPFAEVICFTLLIVAVSSIHISPKPILNTMIFCGTAMGIYVILQKLGFDQFWIARTENAFTAVTAQSVGGNLGQPTIVASFLAMIVPIAFCMRRYWMSAVMVIAVFFTQSDMAIAAIFLLVAVFFTKTFGLKIIIPILILMTVLTGIGFATGKLQATLSGRASGRFEVWGNVFSDIKNGPIEGSTQDFSATGVGFGRFSYIFPDKHKSTFQQAHNDLLEFAYNCGLIGLLLLLWGIGIMVYQASLSYSTICFSILLGFLTILFISLGSFPFQLGAHQYYAAILVGLLNNKTILGRVRC